MESPTPDSEHHSILVVPMIDLPLTSARENNPKGEEDSNGDQAEWDDNGSNWDDHGHWNLNVVWGLIKGTFVVRDNDIRKE